MLDLHTHSRYSDGSDTPAELAARGAALKLRALALTDHDTLEGIPAFLAACRARRLTALAGVEISVAAPVGTLHILGLGVDPAHAGLQQALERLRAGRAARNAAILERLRRLGCALTMEEVAAQAGNDEVVGRLHVARALAACGFAADAPQAFARYLARGAPAYIERLRLPPAESMGLIRAAGGLPVIAHPFLWQADFDALERGVAALVADGLGGIEAYYPEHHPEQLVAALRLAHKLGLAVSGGTDYHGVMKPGVALGVARGNFSAPDSLLPPLLAAITGRAGLAGPFE